MIAYLHCFCFLPVNFPSLLIKRTFASRWRPVGDSRAWKSKRMQSSWCWKGASVKYIWIHVIQCLCVVSGRAQMYIQNNKRSRARIRKALTVHPFNSVNINPQKWQCRFVRLWDCEALMSGPPSNAVRSLRTAVTQQQRMPEPLIWIRALKEWFAQTVCSSTSLEILWLVDRRLKAELWKARSYNHSVIESTDTIWGKQPDNKHSWLFWV